jgi:ABC-2 type transport system permease protein
MSAYVALTGAGFRAQTRDKATIFFTFAFPLLFLVIFGLIFHGQKIPETGRPYISYTAPGVLSWGVANAAVFSVAFTLMRWRGNDLLRLIRMTPTTLTSVLGSRYVLALIVVAAQSVLFIAAGMLPVFGLTVDSRWPLVIPILILGVTAFLSIGAFVGNLANTSESVSAIANCMMVPMAFLSGSFLPLEEMPSWVGDISWALPLRYLNNGVSDSLTGRGGMGDILVAAGGLAAFSIVFCALTLRTFRWSNSS